MTALDPTLAADIANGVYGIKDAENMAQANYTSISRENLARAFVSREVGGLERHFDLSGVRIVAGQSGGRIASERSGFGLVMPFTGSRTGQTVIAIRGTATASDGLTDLNGAAATGPTGDIVHAGFKRTYDSICNGLMPALRGATPTTLHVVGHSLGGAVANLIAARLASDRVAHIKLYTFGAPRTGLSGFSQSLTQSVGSSNIHRVYNISDVVPMVPLFPYLHAPHNVDGYRVRTADALLSLNAHFMTNYTNGVANHQWSSLASQSSGVESTLSVDGWIRMAGEHVAIPGSSLAFFAIGKALGALIDFARVSLGMAFLGAATLLDQLAGLLYRAAMLSGQVMERLLQLLRLALRFAGHAAATGERITTTFIVWVLNMMLRPVRAVGNAALARFDR